MSDLEIKDIFEKERFPKSNWQYLSLVVYFPFGLIFALIRFFIGFQALLAGVVLTHTPTVRSVVLRILCFVLGIRVEEDNKCDRNRSSKLIVANCSTKIDYIPMHLVTGCVSPSGKQNILSGLVPGLKDFNDASRSLASMKTFIEKGTETLFLQPEETTSGKKTLLKFTGLPADLCREIQPVSIVVERPTWANPATTVLGASLSSDIFWFLFSPTTLFKIKYLNLIHREDDESDEDFVSRIEKSVAESLGFRTSSFTASDKAEYEKRYVDEYNRQHTHPVLNHHLPPSAELLLMTNQVQQVLPHVPRDVVLADLSRTRSVDITISNILEGLVPFIPIQPQPMGTMHSPSQSSPNSSAEPLFSKSSQDRMMSFADRKAKMIEEARKRYIEKHGLKIE